MLVLTREAKQSVLLGDNVRITIVKIVGDKVRIGFECDGIPISRSEIHAQAIANGDRPAGDLIFHPREPAYEPGGGPG